MFRAVGAIVFDVALGVVTAGAYYAAKAGKLGVTAANLIKKLEKNNLSFSQSEVKSKNPEQPKYHPLPIIQDTCIVEGTPVLTPNGSQPIESLKQGDLIFTRSDTNPNGPLTLRRIENIFILEGEVWELTVRGRLIETTGKHPYYVEEKGWVPVEELVLGDLIRAHDGQLSIVDSVFRTGRAATVYNLRVEEDHTYFIGDNHWGFSLLVHNSYKKVKNPDGTYRIVDNSGKFVKQSVSADDVDKLLDRYNNPKQLWGVENHDKVKRWTKGSIYRDPKTGLWWSKDVDGHGGSAWKVFKENGIGLNHRHRLWNTFFSGVTRRRIDGGCGGECSSGRFSLVSPGSHSDGCG